MPHGPSSSEEPRWITSVARLRNQDVVRVSRPDTLRLLDRGTVTLDGNSTVQSDYFEDVPAGVSQGPVADEQVPCSLAVRVPLSSGEPTSVPFDT